MTFWLSFADETGNLGVAVVDVTPEDIEAAKVKVARDFPNARPGAELVGAAIGIAHRLGCNPGGSVLCFPIPSEHPAPRGVLLTKDEAKQWMDWEPTVH